MFAFFFFVRRHLLFIFFFFNDTATTEIYTLSLHDALPILNGLTISAAMAGATTNSSTTRIALKTLKSRAAISSVHLRSEEHTSELQSLAYLVCRLLLEKKKNNKKKYLLAWLCY